MTAVRALWSPLKQCKLRARHSKRAWLHICKSLGPNDSSERRTGATHVRQKNTKIKAFSGRPGSRTRTCAAQDVCGKELQLLPEEGHVGLSGVDPVQNCHRRLSLRRRRANVTVRPLSFTEKLLDDVCVGSQPSRS